MKFVTAALVILTALIACPADSRPGTRLAAIIKEKAEAGDEQARAKMYFFTNSGTIRSTLQDGLKVNCCGEADAYEADDYELDANGNFYAILTCNDPDDCTSYEGRVERPPGTRIRIPATQFLVPNKPPNNTGHGWVFVGANTWTTDDDHKTLPWPFCYSLPGGA